MRNGNQTSKEKPNGKRTERSWINILIIVEELLQEHLQLYMYVKEGKSFGALCERECVMVS